MGSVGIGLLMSTLSTGLPPAKNRFLVPKPPLSATAWVISAEHTPGVSGERLSRYEGTVNQVVGRRRSKRRQGAQEHLKTAIFMHREMDTRLWPMQAESG